MRRACTAPEGLTSGHHPEPGPDFFPGPTNLTFPSPKERAQLSWPSASRAPPRSAPPLSHMGPGMRGPIDPIQGPASGFAWCDPQGGGVVSFETSQTRSRVTSYRADRGEAPLGIAALVSPSDPLVGRAHELDSLEQLLDELDEGHRGALELAGEPGIGKTRLLRELAARAEARGHLVLSGAASELERGLPFSVFLDALDEYVAGLDPKRLAALDDDVRAELAHVFPSLSGLADGRGMASQHERHRSHRAVRDFLERLAAPTPLVLVLDDVHWADSASVELLGALLRRPPSAPLLMVFAVRPRQMPDRLSAALERAYREGVLTRIELGALSQVEARAFLGEAVDAVQATALYKESGGNPFYLQQLARAVELTDGAAIAVAELSSTIEVPSAVAAALSEELALVSRPARLVLQGAAVVGNRFEPELAAVAAGMSEDSTMEAVDELLQLDLVRQTDVPRRFRFRHPLVRRAVYETTPGGWRLGAHERCAEALAARGANVAARAHHVERSARQGDVGAVAVLREAGEATARLAPESAAQWFGAALRLLPQTAQAEDRVDLLLARAKALAAAGRFTDSHNALLEAVAIVPGGPNALSTTVATACAGVERFLGRYEQANGRLVRALSVLPDRASVESVELLIELTLNEFYRSSYEAMHGWAPRAVIAANEIGDPGLVAAAAVMCAFADAMTGPIDLARSRCAEAAAVVDDLSDGELALRPDTAGWLAIAEVYLDLYAEADGHASRALELTRVTGQGDPLHRLYPVLPRIWYVRGKLAEAAELLDGAIEGARLIGTPPALAGNLFNRSVVAVAVGDLDTALATAEEGAELSRGLDEGFVAAWAAVRLASVLLETGQPEQAVELLLGCAGGEELTLIPGGWKAYCLELLTRCWLALDRRTEAERAAARAEATAAVMRLPLAAAWADRATAAVALNAGDYSRAAEHALASADAAQEVGAPIEAGLSRTLAGQALSQAGQTDRAVVELLRAAAALDACGAVRYRENAERELGKLGHRPHRRTRPGKSDGPGIASLTERELQVAWLVVDRKTNPEIAAELFLSQKTVETHLRNIFHKMDVTTRADLARAVERADRMVSARPR
jgi:ATP/maltotriose-dependent transcriptional regulator MalT